MQNNQRIYIEKISETLSWLETTIKNENSANLTSLAKISEGFFLNFLNALFDWNLVNVNEVHQREKGIDLLFIEEKIIIQVSSDLSKGKIQESLNRIDLNKYNGYHFIFLGIGSQGKHKYKDIRIPPNIMFSTKTDIYDVPKLLECLTNIQIEKLRRLYIMTMNYYSKSSAPSTREDGALKKDISETSTNSKKLIGYCINFGMNSCRVFEIYDKRFGGLCEIDPIPYNVLPPINNRKNEKNKREDFLAEIIRISCNDLSGIFENGRYIKIFADAEFIDLFSDNESKDTFIEKYYKTTGRYFHILTQKQTEENLKALFSDIEPKTAIIDICSTCVYVVINLRPGFKSFLVKISTKDIRSFTDDGDWGNSRISYLKGCIKNRIGELFNNIKASKAIIIKEELFFMRTMGYPLRNNGGSKCISFADYSNYNERKIYQKKFQKTVDRAFSEIDERKRNKYYGFKEGHIILETIFEILGVDTIIPTDVPNILNSQLPYIFNVVLSGSTKPEHVGYMKEAYKFFNDIQKVTVLHPHLLSIGEKSRQSYQDHEHAIKNCDLLFVCNGDGYIGTQTKCDIYAASLLSKPIAYWLEPDRLQVGSEEYDYSSFVPHDIFKDLMESNGYISSVSPNIEVTSHKPKGCIIGSFRKFYSADITTLINKFAEKGIVILSPKNSAIINPNVEFVRLESDDTEMPEHEIQAKVFENVIISDFVYVWDPNGYIGKTTCYEIGRIIERGIPIYYKEKPLDIPLEIPEDKIVEVEELIEIIKGNVKHSKHS